MKNEEEMKQLMDYKDISQVLDSPIEEVALALDELTLGELTSFKKMLEMHYTELEHTKNQLLHIDEKSKTQAQVLAKDFYKLMQKVEDVATVTEELRQQRKLTI